jgi:transcriptional regulator with XRE-family HTH domain
VVNVELKIKGILAKRHMSIRQLAKRAEVGSGYLNELLNSKYSNPSAEYL